MNIYVDRFEGEYVTERDAFAPPERYYEIIPNNEDCYTEKWLMEGMKHCNISYLEEELKNPKYINILRESIFKGARPLYMISWCIPANKYKEIENIIKEEGE